ncbi:hypothetical protein CLV84_1700 [Neolewinella xylanilytica]|uniref:Uncharacterized protein n=1 Tax=Neolewinella xylanilytica TaxID=1514080 RepID=A0A2S6IB94_9BACT|nr:hypothetical protein [Neolewinella xylanilytica]PPK88729.1 hypothetical protein CLV84_1700 [Neolewinella xylanilytica]
MEYRLLPLFNWMDLLLGAVVLYGVYVLLYLLRDRLGKTKRPEGFRARAFNVLAAALLLYEPTAALVLIVIFVFINPGVHGLVTLLIVAAGFSRLRDYLSGRIVLFTPLISVGKRMKTERYTGVISRINRIGLYLQTGEGLHFVNYTSLLTQGYSLITGKDIGGYYQLVLTPPEDREDPLEELADRLTTTPYLDRSFRPELAYAEYGQDRIHARLSVREEKHLTELLALLQEWGYPATIAQR